MKKIISIMLCLILAFLLFSCNEQSSAAAKQSKDTTEAKVTKPTGVSPNKLDINADLLKYDEGISPGSPMASSLVGYYGFDSFDRFLAHFSNKATAENSIVQAEKAVYGMIYMTLVNELTESSHIKTPHIDGTQMLFSKVGLIAHYSDPCVVYDGIYEGANPTIKVYYPHIEEHKEFSQDLSAAEILKLVCPGEINVHNYKEKPNTYKAVYEKEILFLDRTLSAIVYEENNYDQIIVKFYYDGMFISISMKNAVFNSDFFEHFSMQ
jgi:hypothetical protein